MAKTSKTKTATEPEQDPTAVYLAADTAANSVNSERRTVDVLFYTGVDIMRHDWGKGDYVLRFDPAGADLSMLNSGAPVLDSHNAYSVRDQLGITEKGWSKGKNQFATLRFSKRDDMAGVWQDVEDGIINKFSMGVRLLETVETPATEKKLRMVTATKWQPFEISTVPLAADMNTRRLAGDPTADDAPEARAASPLEDSMKDPIAGIEAREQPAAPPPAPIASSNLLDSAKQTEQLIAQERERCTTLSTLGEKFGQQKLAAEYVRDGKTVQQFRDAVLDLLAAHSNETVIRTAAMVTHDEVDTRRNLAENALLHSYDGGRHKLVEGNPFRHMRVTRMAEELLSRRGIAVVGLDRNRLHELSMQNTADFPYVLENVARKQMLTAYEVAVPTYRLWAKRSTTPDFKTMSRLRLSEAPEFKIVPEGGQITIGSMTESREQYAIATYGRGISFTRQMFINDDLGAFMDLVGAFGQQASRLENATVYAVLNANAAMADGVALFHATHNNLGSGAIGNTALDAMFAGMGVQKGLDGLTVLNLTPKFLIVPKAKEATARTSQIAIGPNVKVSDQNWFAGRLEVVADGVLDATSTAVWYGACDPSIGPGVEYAHLEGGEGPQIIRKENEQGILGVNVYGFIDFGAKAVDFRTMWKSTGV